LLLAYSWPGNVRELRNIIERICIMASGPLLEPAYLPPELHQSAPVQKTTITEENMEQGLDISVANYEKQLVASALERSEGNVLKASLMLKIPRGTLRYKMEKYGL